MSRASSTHPLTPFRFGCRSHAHTLAMNVPVRVAVATPAEWPEVAAWVFVHLRDPHAAVRADRLIQLILTGQVPSAGVLVARAGESVVGGMVVQHLPGGSAVVLPPGGESEAVRDALTRAAVARFPAAGVSVAQAFLDPGDEPRADVLTRHGFRAVTSILHLSSDSPADVPPVAHPDVALMRYADADPRLFADTLMATYRDSLDVPEANAGRTAAEAVAGYRFGQPDPPDWWLATDRAGVPLGVLLLSDFADRAVLEVAYLGVVPEARGRGVGGRLLEWAIRRASGGRELNLSVDERNRAAQRLYARYGLRARHTQRVLLWVRAVSAT